MTEKPKKIIINEWTKQFLLGASLILFAGIVFYIVAPKWHYFRTNSGLFGRYNAITGEVWWGIVGDYGEGQARIVKVRLKTVKNYTKFYGG
jgi:hypothetical protein